MKYFTSDLHLHHPFVAALRGYIRADYQPMSAQELREYARVNNLDYASLVDWRQHDTNIINVINATVGVDDELFVLGDLSSGGRMSMDAMLHELDRLTIPREQRHLILGNHESTKPSKAMIARLCSQFADATMRGETMIEGLGVVRLSHYQFAYHFDERPESELSTNAHAKHFGKRAYPDDGHTILLHGHTHSKIPREYDNPRELNIGWDAWHKPVSETVVRDMFLEVLRG